MQQHNTEASGIVWPIFRRNLRRQHFINVSIWLNEKGGERKSYDRIKSTHIWWELMGNRVWVVVKFHLKFFVHHSRGIFELIISEGFSELIVKNLVKKKKIQNSVLLKNFSKNNFFLIWCKIRFLNIYKKKIKGKWMNPYKKKS